MPLARLPMNQLSVILEYTGPLQLGSHTLPRKLYSLYKPLRRHEELTSSDKRGSFCRGEAAQGVGGGLCVPKMAFRLALNPLTQFTPFSLSRERQVQVHPGSGEETPAMRRLRAILDDDHRSTDVRDSPWKDAASNPPTTSASALTQARPSPRISRPQASCPSFQPATLGYQQQSPYLPDPSSGIPGLLYRRHQ